MEEGMLGFRIQARRGGSCGDGGAGIGTKCGRWNPTSEQVKVLMDLFRSGLRTPTTDQIQKISTELSFYGKIESKNVFYWFQNHKARERQKRRRVSKEHDNDAACFQLDDHHVRAAAPKKYFGEINQVRSEAGAIQTLQLFPLNSYHLEPCSDNLGKFSNECKENKYATFAYAFGREFEHPPLDLRLSFF